MGGIKNKKTNMAINYNSVPYNVVSYDVIENFYGQLTGYGPDCFGCKTGRTAYGYNVKDGNIFYNDKQYGRVRIVAADKKFPYGTILRITAPNLYDYSFVAIVLDRGGKIKDQKFDLLFESEEGLRRLIGYQRNVKYEVLRYGWK